MSDPVTGDELREMQRPIKDRYRDDAETAQITLEADGTLDEDIACSVQTGRRSSGRASTRASGATAPSPAPGTCCSGPGRLRRDDDPVGGDLDGLNVIGTVHAEGALDWRGTLAVDKEAPVGFKEIRLRFELESDASDEELETLERLDRALLRRLPDPCGGPLGLRLHGAILTEEGVQAPDVRAFSLISAAGRMAIGLGCSSRPSSRSARSASPTCPRRPRRSLGSPVSGTSCSGA